MSRSFSISDLETKEDHFSHQGNYDRQKKTLIKLYLYLHSLNGKTNNGIDYNIRPEERLTTTRACANQQEGGRSKDISWPEPDIALYHPTTRRLGLEAWLSIPFRSGSQFLSSIESVIKDLVCSIVWGALLKPLLHHFSIASNGVLLVLAIRFLHTGIMHLYKISPTLDQTQK